MNTSLPELLIEMEPVQLMNQLLMQLTTKLSTKIHPTPLPGTAIDNILDWLENFDRIAVQNVWNDQKQLQIIPVYLKDTALNFYHSLPDQIKTDINLLKAALCNPIPNMLHTWIPTLLLRSNSYLRYKKTWKSCSRWNVVPVPPGNYRSFRTTDGLVICPWCNQFGSFARACWGNLPLPKAPLPYQNHQLYYVHPGPSQYPRSSYTPQHLQVNILNALPIDHTLIDTILWAILIREMSPIPIPHDDHHFHPLIKPTTSTC